MRVAPPPNEESLPRPPDPNEPMMHPLLALSVALSLAVGTAGLSANWDAAVTVFTVVLAVLRPPNQPR